MLSNDDNPYYNIPEIVAFITLLYVHIAEYFDVPGSTLTISEDHMKATYQEISAGEDKAAYGVNRVNSQNKAKKYTWKFRINIIDQDVFIVVEDKLYVKDGDIITLELDLEEQKLYLNVNQKRHYEYIKTKLADKDYKLAVCLDDRASVIIIEFDSL